MKKWFLLVIMTYTAFIFNTAEFIPIGLLTDIASYFGISEAHASLLISVYAWFVALMSLPLMLAVGRCDFRKVLLGIAALFAVSHLLSALASHFVWLLLARLGVACAHAVFWSIVSPLAVHLAPEGKRETALGMIVTGTSLAIIAGLPLGRVVGLWLNWQASFACIGIAALLALVLLAFLFPHVPNKQNASFRSVPQLLKSPVLRGFYVFTFLAVTAHYTGYSYIEPFLKQVVGMSDSLTTFTLVLFGAAGIVSSILFSRYFNKHPRLFLIAVAIGFVVLLISMQVLSSNPYVSIAHCMVWGLAFTLFNAVTEFEVIRHSPQSTTIAVALYSSIFNIGIGCGAVVGGAVLTVSSLSCIGYVGGIIAIVALGFVLGKLLPVLRHTLAHSHSG